VSDTGEILLEAVSGTVGDKRHVVDNRGGVKDNFIDVAPPRNYVFDPNHCVTGLYFEHLVDSGRTRSLFRRAWSGDRFPGTAGGFAVNFLYPSGCCHWFKRQAGCN